MPFDQILDVGRPPKLDDSDKRSINRYIINNPAISLKGVCRRLFSEKDKSVSKSTVDRFFDEAKVTTKVPLCAPMLTKRHKLERIKFAKSNLERDWKKVIFSDEATFELNPMPKVVRSKKGRPVRIAQNQYNPKVMVWGCFSLRGIGKLVFVEGSVTSVKYVDILHMGLTGYKEDLKSGNYIFQQENAPVHTAKHSKRFFEESKYNVLKWPAKSPDLNPIENIWAILKSAVSQANPRTMNDLKEKIIPFPLKRSKT